jgi:uncharacterized protein YbjT (DUF2867 family)
MGRDVFISGATGFMGRALMPELVAHGHGVTALIRREAPLAAGVRGVLTDPFQPDVLARVISPGSTFVHLIGAKSPAPWKKAQFRAIDLASALASIEAARRAQVAHFVYLSVAQPAPTMKDYIAVRQEGEAALRASGLNATAVRPWYVLGPGRQWPVVLKPMYWLMEQIPMTRESAVRLGLVTQQQMTATLLSAVEHPASGFRIVETAAIRRGSAV